MSIFFQNKMHIFLIIFLSSIGIKCISTIQWYSTFKVVLVLVLFVVVIKYVYLELGWGETDKFPNKYEYYCLICVALCDPGFIKL